MNVKRAWVDTESGVVLIFESLDESLTRTQARAQLAALFLERADSALSNWEERDPETV